MRDVKGKEEKRMDEKKGLEDEKESKTRRSTNGGREKDVKKEQ